MLGRPTPILFAITQPDIEATTASQSATDSNMVDSLTQQLDTDVKPAKLAVKSEDMEVDMSAMVDAANDTSNTDDESGVATLLMMRRRKDATKQELPAPLKTISTTTTKGSAANIPLLSAFPSSHPYYRSKFVLATPSTQSSAAIKTELKTPKDVAIRSPKRIAVSAREPSLPTGLSNLRLNTQGHFKSQSTSVIESMSVQSPKIYIPPPRFSPHMRRLSSHRRSISDGTLPPHRPMESQTPSSRLRFIPPPPLASRSTRKYISPPAFTSSSQRYQDSRYAPYESDRRYWEPPMRSPIKESFVRTPVKETFAEPPHWPMPDRKEITYKPCGNVETRRLRSPSPSINEQKGRKIEKPKLHMIHPYQVPGGHMRTPSLTHSAGPSTYGSAKRTYDDAQSGSARFHESQTFKRPRYDGPQFSMIPPDSARRYILPLASGRKRDETSNYPSMATSGQSTTPPSLPPGTASKPPSILEALLGEISGKGSEGEGDESAAKALEEVAAKLAMVATRLRSRS